MRKKMKVKIRKTWWTVKPVTRIISSKKTYNRRKDKNGDADL